MNASKTYATWRWWTMGSRAMVFWGCGIGVVAGSGSAPRGAAGAQRDVPVETRGEIATILTAALDSIPIPGFALGIVDGEHLVFAQGFGVADLITREPITEHTIFQIGSISKSFTATMLGMLADEGRLELDDGISEYIVSATFPSPAITLTHLATHSSGLPRDAPTLRRLHGDYPVLAFTHFELYRSIAESRVAFTPGARWAYSNFGYGILGHALEVVTQTPYEVLVGEMVFDPLGMESSTVTIWPELAPRLATPYYLEDGRLREYTPWDQEALAPAGGIASTIEDLARYVSFQLRVGSGSGFVASLQRPRYDVNEGLRYGMGWFVEDVGGVGTVVSVGGDVDGYVGEIVMIPGERLGVISLANTGDAGPLPNVGRWVAASLVASYRRDAEREARYRRGLLHQDLREWSAAYDTFARLIADDPTHAAARYQLGRTGDLSGRYLTEAAAALRAYVTRPPAPGLPYAAAWWRLGSVYEQLGRCNDAVDAYRRALADNPNYGPAQTALAAAPCREQVRPNSPRRRIR